RTTSKVVQRREYSYGPTAESVSLHKETFLCMGRAKKCQVVSHELALNCAAHGVSLHSLHPQRSGEPLQCNGRNKCNAMGGTNAMQPPYRQLGDPREVCRRTQPRRSRFALQFLNDFGD